MTVMDAVGPSPLAQALLHRVNDDARRQAVSLHAPGGSLRLDHGQLWDWVEQLTRQFQQRGLCAGDRLAWLGLNHPLQLAALMACARLGAIFLPLNFRLAAAEVQQVMDDATPAWLVHDAGHAEVAAVLRGPNRLSQDELMASPCAQELVCPPTDGDTPVLLVYTSGTTGRPRGAVHTQGALLANARASEWAHGFTSGDVVLSTLPLFHVGGLCIQTLPALLAGVPVILHPRFEPKAWLDEVAGGAPTLSLLVPATMRAVIEHRAWSGVSLGRLRGIMTGSSTVPLHYLQAFHARGVPVGQVYGSTETGPVSVVLRLRDAIDREGETGWPHPGARLRLLDGEGHEVPAGETGEVCLQADNLMWGYWSPEGRAGDGLRDGWFHTGDLGCQAPDGCLRIVGRAKDMIISGGENIYPAELEKVLHSHPAIAEAAVIGVPDAKWGEVGRAVVVARADGLTETEVLDFLRERVARYKVPKSVAFVTELPRNPTGKIQKAVLRDQYTTLLV